MSKIKVYLKPNCPYCKRVQSFLKDKNFEFEMVDVSNDYELYSDLKEKTGHQTVPQVFIDDKFIGGADDFFKLIKTKSIFK